MTKGEIALRKELGDRTYEAAVKLLQKDAIQEVIEDVLKDYTMQEATELVLSKGIPAGPILDVSQILADPHVKAREMFVEMDHPTLGRITVNGCAIKLMDTKPSVRTPAPALGQDNRAVYQGLLGLTDAQFDALCKKHVF